jgi:hypothetical protein
MSDKWPLRLAERSRLAKRKTEEESLAQRRPDAPHLPKVEIDFETLVAAVIAAAIIRSPKKAETPQVQPSVINKILGRGCKSVFATISGFDDDAAGLVTVGQTFGLLLR